MKELLEQYDIGLAVNPTDHAAAAAAMEHMRDDKELYAKFKSNLVRAKEGLCWENEKLVLKTAYSDAFAKAERLHKRSSAAK